MRKKQVDSSNQKKVMMKMKECQSEKTSYYQEDQVLGRVIRKRDSCNH